MRRPAATHGADADERQRDPFNDLDVVAAGHFGFSAGWRVGRDRDDDFVRHHFATGGRDRGRRSGRNWPTRRQRAHHGGQRRRRHACCRLGDNGRWRGFRITHDDPRRIVLRFGFWIDDHDHGRRLRWLHHHDGRRFRRLHDDDRLAHEAACAVRAHALAWRAEADRAGDAAAVADNAHRRFVITFVARSLGVGPLVARRAGLRPIDVIAAGLGRQLRRPIAHRLESVDHRPGAALADDDAGQPRPEALAFKLRHAHEGRAAALDALKSLRQPVRRKHRDGRRASCQHHDE